MKFWKSVEYLISLFARMLIAVTTAAFIGSQIDFSTWDTAKLIGMKFFLVCLGLWAIIPAIKYLLFIRGENEGKR